MFHFPGASWFESLQPMKAAIFCWIRSMYHYFCTVLFTLYLPPVNEVWGKVMFLHLCVILFRGVLTSQHASQVTWPGGVCPQEGFGRPPTPDGILWDTVKKRTVRMLLECILVFVYVNVDGLMHPTYFYHWHSVNFDAHANVDFAAHCEEGSAIGK